MMFDRFFATERVCSYLLYCCVNHRLSVVVAVMAFKAAHYKDLESSALSRIEFPVKSDGLFL